ncbi:MAG: acyltransferase family protein [Bacteroides sp.]|nr:acyltransferase family protein [Eubacterium sp.]MCM1417968.1 acyltransferase family protein [Roseburia sp.]MCM1461785.1 acyltransferase family protein [Bacteroides sp.]
MAESTVGQPPPRYAFIEVLRFVFALIVLMCHSHGLRPVGENYPFAGGYIAVEFFLILSGYFAVKHIDGGKRVSAGKVAFDYTTKQFKKLFPVVAISVVIHYMVFFLNGEIDAQDLPYMLYEILLLPQSGIYKIFLNLPLWYLSAYLICMPLFLYFWGRFRDFFFHIGSILTPLLIYGFICRNCVHLDIWSFASGYPFIGLFRVFAGLCMGAVCYRISLSLKKSRVYQTGGLFILGLVIMYTAFFFKTYADYFLVLAMTLALAGIFAGNERRPLKNGFSLFLGKYSVYLYCSHWTIRYLIPRLFPLLDYWTLLPIYVVSSLLYALAIMLTCRVACFAAAWRKRKEIENDPKI